MLGLPRKWQRYSRASAPCFSNSTPQRNSELDLFSFVSIFTPVFFYGSLRVFWLPPRATSGLLQYYSSVILLFFCVLKKTDSICWLCDILVGKNVFLYNPCGKSQEIGNCGNCEWALWSKWKEPEGGRSWGPFSSKMLVRSCGRSTGTSASSSPPAVVGLQSLRRHIAQGPAMVTKGS